MTDIVNTLRGGFCEPNTGCMSIKKCVCDVLDEAADEIERLRNLVDQCDHHEHSLQEAQARIVELEDTYDRMRDQLLSEKFSLEHDLDTADVEIERLRTDNDLWNGRLSYAHAEIERLTACLKWEQNWFSRVGTHAPGCWQWGPGHYLCAVRHIEGLEHAATEPTDPADHAQG